MIGHGRVVTPCGGAHVRGDALTASIDLDGCWREPRLHLLVDQRVRDRVVMTIDLDVIVDVDASLLPFAVDKRHKRQRPKSWTVDALEKIGAARLVHAHDPGVQFREQLGDALIERAQREEGLVAQTRQDPALGDLHAYFDLGFVPWMRRSSGQHRRAVVLRHLFVGTLDAGLYRHGLDTPERS